MKNNKNLIHVLIGIAIAMVFRFLIPVGTLPGVTAVGMQVVGVFIATIYMWSTVDPSLGSITSIVLLGFSDFGRLAADGTLSAGGGMTPVLAQTFGSAVLVQCLFLMIIAGGLTDRRINAYIARFILTRKFIEGNPWVFVTCITLGSYVMAVFLGCFAPIFLFWPVLTEVYEEVGFAKRDKFPKLMTIMVVMGALVGFPVPPFMGNGLALIGSWHGIVANATAEGTVLNAAMINNGKYLIACFILGVIVLVAMIAVMKFILKPDVTPLKSITIEMLNKNPLPPMNPAQRLYAIVYVIMILCMLLPTIIKGVAIFDFIQANNYGVGLAVTAALLAIHAEGDGGKNEPLLRFGPVMATKINWGTYYIIAAALVIGTALTNKATGVTAFLNQMLSPIFAGMSGTTFTIVLLIACVILTNICNSLVIGILLQPVVLSFCAQSGVAAAPIVTLLIFTVLSTAAVTPAASPFAAMLFGNKEFLDNGDIYKNCSILVVTEVILVLVIGIPMMSMFM